MAAAGHIFGIPLFPNKHSLRYFQSIHQKEGQTISKKNINK
jgi:hypothetical protein